MTINNWKCDFNLKMFALQINNPTSVIMTHIRYLCVASWLLTLSKKHLTESQKHDWYFLFSTTLSLSSFLSTTPTPTLVSLALPFFYSLSLFPSIWFSAKSVRWQTGKMTREKTSQSEGKKCGTFFLNSFSYFLSLITPTKTNWSCLKTTTLHGLAHFL